MKHLYIFIFLLLNGLIYGQNYRAIQLNNELFYSFKGKSKIVGLAIDSMQISGSDTISHSYPFILTNPEIVNFSPLF